MKSGERPPHLFRRTRPHPSAERGSVALWVAVMAAAVILTLVLIVDGGAKIRAGNRADIAATEAARAAVLAVGPRGSGSGMQARLAVAAVQGLPGQGRRAGLGGNPGTGSRPGRRTGNRAGAHQRPPVHRDPHRGSRAAGRC